MAGRQPLKVRGILSPSTEMSSSPIDRRWPDFTPVFLCVLGCIFASFCCLRFCPAWLRLESLTTESRRDSAMNARTSVTLDSHRVGGRRDQTGYIKISPLRRLIGENQFKLVEPPPIRSRSASPLPAQFPIAAVAVKQKPVFRMDGDGQVGSPNRHCSGQGVARTATAGDEDLFWNPLLQFCAEDPAPRRHKPQISALCRLGQSDRIGAGEDAEGWFKLGSQEVGLPLGHQHVLKDGEDVVYRLRGIALQIACEGKEPGLWLPGK